MICCHCGKETTSNVDEWVCDLCAEWGIQRADLTHQEEQFHRIGKGGSRYWGQMGAGILFTDGKSILLLKRKEPSDHAGTWGIPGGKSKSGEAPIDTARRESKEECGVPVSGNQFARFHDKDGRHNFHVFLYATQTPFSCSVSDEHSDAKWVPLAELRNLPLHPKMKESLPRYERAIKSRFPAVSFAEWVHSRLTAG